MPPESRAVSRASMAFLLEASKPAAIVVQRPVIRPAPPPPHPPLSPARGRGIRLLSFIPLPSGRGEVRGEPIPPRLDTARGSVLLTRNGRRRSAAHRRALSQLRQPRRRAGRH